MNHSLLYWLRLLLSFLGLWGCIWLIAVIYATKRDEGLTGPIARFLNWNTMFRHTMNLCRVVVGIVIGVAAVNLYEYHNLEVVSNVVVDSQQGNYVEYHYRNDPARQSYGWHFCASYIPYFQPRQIIDHIVYVREPSGCEDLGPYKTSLKLVRVRGIPVLDNTTGE